MTVEEYNDLLWKITNAAIPTVLFIIIWGSFATAAFFLGYAIKLLF